MDATFVRKQLLAPNIWEFFVKPSGRLDYQAGQYADVQLDVAEDPREPRRTFTLTSLPGDEELSFAVKIPEQHTAYKTALLELRSRDTLKISQAMGDLVLPRDTGRPLVFVAGGLGIASFVSMMKWLTEKHEQRSIRLLYAHKPDEVLFEDVIAICPGLRARHIISPQRLTAVDIVTEQSDNTLYYISGSEQFTLGFRDQLRSAHGINPTNIAYDYFDGYQSVDF